MEIKKIIISMLLLVVFLPIALAQPSIEDDTNTTNSDNVTNIENMNSTNDTCAENSMKTCDILTELGVVEGARVPFVLPRNGVLNMYFSNDTIIGYTEIKAGEISEIVCCEEHLESTHTVLVENFEVVQEIKDAEDYLDEANTKLNNGEIDISANSIVNKARLGIGKAILKVASWFR